MFLYSPIYSPTGLSNLLNLTSWTRWASDHQLNQYHRPLSGECFHYISRILVATFSSQSPHFFAHFESHHGHVGNNINPCRISAERFREQLLLFTIWVRSAASAHWDPTKSFAVRELKRSAAPEASIKVSRSHLVLSSPPQSLPCSHFYHMIRLGMLRRFSLLGQERPLVQ